MNILKPWNFTNYLLFDEEPSGGGGGGEKPKPPEEQKPPPETKPSEEGDDPPGPVPYERFSTVNKKAAELEEENRLLKEADKKRKEDELKEQNKWQELAKAREDELAAEKLRNTRMQIALEKGLPVEMAERLQGENEEELRADADRMKDYIKPQTPGSPPPGDGHRKEPLDISKMSPKDIRKNSEELAKKANKK